MQPICAPAVGFTRISFLPHSVWCSRTPRMEAALLCTDFWRPGNGSGRMSRFPSFTGGSASNGALRQISDEAVFSIFLGNDGETIGNGHETLLWRTRS